MTRILRVFLPVLLALSVIGSVDAAQRTPGGKVPVGQVVTPPGGGGGTNADYITLWMNAYVFDSSAYALMFRWYWGGCVSYASGAWVSAFAQCQHGVDGTYQEEWHNNWHLVNVTQPPRDTCVIRASNGLCQTIRFYTILQASNDFTPYSCHKKLLIDINWYGQVVNVQSFTDFADFPNDTC